MVSPGLKNCPFWGLPQSRVELVEMWLSAWVCPAVSMNTAASAAISVAAVSDASQGMVPVLPFICCSLVLVGCSPDGLPVGRMVGEPAGTEAGVVDHADLVSEGSRWPVHGYCFSWDSNSEMRLFSI